MMHFRKILTVLLVLLPAGAGAVLLFLMNADLYIRFSQKTGMVKGEVNSWQDKSREIGAEKDPGDGLDLAGGIAYADTYPNSFLDIYRTEDSEGPKPVYFFIHGGGYAWGDKAEGDPLGASDGSSGGMTDVFRRLAKENIRHASGGMTDVFLREPPENIRHASGGSVRCPQRISFRFISPGISAPVDEEIHGLRPFRIFSPVNVQETVRICVCVGDPACQVKSVPGILFRADFSGFILPAVHFSLYHACFLGESDIQIGIHQKQEDSSCACRKKNEQNRQDLSEMHHALITPSL